jgi:hypothetical protein
MRNLTREYSLRLGVISAKQFQAALDRFDLGKLLDAQPATAGLFGQNVFLSTTKGEYVLRGCPHYSWQFPKERYFAKQIDEHTSVAAPWPYEIDPSSELFGWSYAIMPRLPGLLLDIPETQSQLSDQDRLGLARALGETLGLLQEHTWEYPGEYDLDADTVVPLAVSYPEWVLAHVRHDLEHCGEYNDATTGADIAWANQIITETRDALNVPFRPTLVHHDYWEHNVTADRVGLEWRVTGLFDLMGMYVGDGEVDVVRSVAEYTKRRSPEVAFAFVRAYRNRQHLRPGFAERFQLYMLADRLVIWEYGQRNGVWFDKGLTFREYAEPYVNLKVLTSVL